MRAKNGTSKRNATEQMELDKQNELYRQSAATYDGALKRLAKAYEADPEIRRDLLQEMHAALWQSFAGFNHLCSLRTWVYRVAHSVGASHVIKNKRISSKTWLDLDELEDMADGSNAEEQIDRNLALEWLMKTIQRFDPRERQVILLYLEGLNAEAIGEIAGISSSNAAIKIHRIKTTLIQRFHQRRTS
jgi:RNA polymerase sigma-70 factor, ECF subfamily